MQRTSADPTMKITTIGIDLAKNVFQVQGADVTGRCVSSQQLSHKKLALFMANVPPCVIGMEACNGDHYWARGFIRWDMRCG